MAKKKELTARAYSPSDGARLEKQFHKAIGGLKQAKSHLEFIGGNIVTMSGVYKIINDCLKDLGVE